MKTIIDEVNRKNQRRKEDLICGIATIIVTAIITIVIIKFV
jgi:hypothetical protein